MEVNKTAAAVAAAAALIAAGLVGSQVGDDGAQTETVTVNQPEPKKAGTERVFDIGCDYSHTLPDDPIVAYGSPGYSHLHDFVGYTKTNAFTTNQELHDAVDGADTPTTCTEFDRETGPKAADASGHWMPAVYVNGVLIPLLKIHVYYFCKGARCAPFTTGFRMIAGNPHATRAEAEEARVVKWYCGGKRFPTISVIPRDCDYFNGIQAEVDFPSCWDGRDDDPPPGDHRGHMAYHNPRGGCPASHPIHVPRLVFVASYSVVDVLKRQLCPPDGQQYQEQRHRSVPCDPDKLTVASGGMWTLHADYMFGWDEARFKTLVDECLNNPDSNCKRHPPES